MIKLSDITKIYNFKKSNEFQALKGISLEISDGEFCAIMGKSGSGKSTLLHIIGMLDRFSGGEYLFDKIDVGKSSDGKTAKIRAGEIGFVKQDFALIEDYSVTDNVMLPLYPIKSKDKRKKALAAIEKLGISHLANKDASQLSGGEKQRVAIARAIVNDPKIILADEPTGALDSETSIQIMELVKEIAKDRLVIMVTHNPDLANDYATRIVKLVDGEIKSDTQPFDPAEEKTEKKAAVKSKSSKKTKMGFLTALSLSRNNLMTKKGRTFLTAFAGSIGIIGIALILSLSNGVQTYIDDVEHSTLASYPIQLEHKAVNYSGLMSTLMDTGESERNKDRDPDRVYTNDLSSQMMKTMLSEIKENNLDDFMEYLNSNPDNIKDSISEIKYGHKSKLYVFAHDINNKVMRVNPSTATQAMMGEEMAGSVLGMMGTMSTFTGVDMSARANCFEQLLSNDRINEQYETIAGRLPENYDEVVVIVNKHNEMSNITLYTLGLLDQAELGEMMSHLLAGEAWDIETGGQSYSYDELMNLKFTALTPSDLFKENDKGGYDDMSGDQEYMENVLKNGLELKVVGIIRPNGDSLISSNTEGGIGYTYALTEHMIEKANNSELVKYQQDNPETDIFTGIEFPKKDEKPKEPMSQEEAMAKIMEILSQEQLAQIFRTVLETLPQDKQMEIMQLPQEQQFERLSQLAEPNKVTGALMSVLTVDQMEKLQEMTKQPEKTEATYEGNLELLGVDDLSKPDTVYIYAKDFESKEKISDLISQYNQRVIDEGREEDAIEYTDYVGMMISGVSDIINAISYILIAFVAISLIVSSIMIGIITYISVLERTKEIGILRAMGASKGNISNVFNAETLIVGFAAGVIGILVTVLLNIPINMIILKLTGIKNISSSLPPVAGAALVVISMLLTLIAGLFPASIAAKKDPVIALRTE